MDSNLWDGAQVNPQDGDPAPQAPTPDNSPFFDAGDVAAAPFRGLADAGAGLVNFGGFLGDQVGAGFHVDAHPLGQSHSTVGGFLEGATEFSAGFLPIGGVLGRFGKIASIGLDLTKGAEEAAQFGEFAVKARSIALARNAVAGAATGFTLFEGHEARLSNLIQSNPSLANPITEFLAAKPGDSEATGRLKNALEFAGMGAAVDALFLGVKALKVAREARAADPAITEATLEDLVNKAVPQKDLAEAYARGAGEPVQAAAPEAIPLTPPGETQVAPAPTPEEAAAEITKRQAARRLTIRNSLADIGAQPDTADAMVQRTADWKQNAGDVLAPDYVPGAPVEGNLNPRDFGKTDRSLLGLVNDHLNLETMNGDAASVVRAAYSLADSETSLAAEAHAPQTTTEQVRAAIQENADLIGERNLNAIITKTIATVPADLQNAETLFNRMRFVNVVLQRAAEQHVGLLQQYQAVRSGAATGDIMALADRVTQGTRQLAQLHDAASSYGSLKGRALQAQQTGFNAAGRFLKGMKADPADLARSVNEAGGIDAIDKMVQQQLAANQGSGAAGIYQGAVGNWSERVRSMTTEYWLNSIISGVKTASAITLGTATASIYRPLEKLMGASILKAVSEGTANPAMAAMQSGEMAKSLSMLTGLSQAASDTFKSAKAMGFGADVFDARHGLIDPAIADRPRAISAIANGLNPDSLAGTSVDWAGKVVNFPSQLHNRISNFIKEINFRASARQQLADAALQEPGMTPENMGGWIQDRYDAMVKDGQAYSQKRVAMEAGQAATQAGITDPAEAAAFVKDYVQKNHDPLLSSISKQAMDYGRENTFTTPAAPKSFSADLQRLEANHPMLRFVIPFVNKPLNILGWAGQRMDILGTGRAIGATVFPDYATALEGTRNRMVQDALSGDPGKYAEAVGRMATGASLGTTILLKAFSGDVSGRGPSNPDERKVLQDSGWQPYSVKVGNGWLSYSRMEPFAALVGTAADIAQYTKYAHAEDQPVLEQLADGLMVALANNFTNKTYLAGLSNFVEALQAPDKKVPIVLQRYAGSFVPSILAQGDLAIGGDENVRDVRSILDAVVSRTPGLSSSLPPQRNVMGEPIQRVTAAGTGDDPITRWVDWFNPIAYREVSDNQVKTELANLGHAFTPPKRTVNGLDLSSISMPNGQTAYDRWSELHGTVREGGLNIQDAMRRLFNSAQYKRMPAESTPTYVSPRVDAVNSIINDYRARAYQQLLRESPELTAHERDFTVTKRNLKAGIDTRIIPQ